MTMNNKIKQAFIDCENFIDKCTPKELKEYEKSLNLNYESYYTPNEKEEKMKKFNYLREKVRMLEKLGCLAEPRKCCNNNCHKCPLSIYHNLHGVNCKEYELQYADKATETVRKWAEEHPRKIRKDVLLEKFPNAILNDNGYPAACAKDLGLTQGCCLDDWCKDCWNTEVEE